MKRKNTTADKLREAASALSRAATAHERELGELYERILSGGYILDAETKLAAIESILQVTSNLGDTSPDCRAYIARALSGLDALRKEIRGKRGRS